MQGRIIPTWGPFHLAMAISSFLSSFQFLLPASVVPVVASSRCNVLKAEKSSPFNPPRMRNEWGMNEQGLSTSLCTWQWTHFRIKPPRNWQRLELTARDALIVLIFLQSLCKEEQIASTDNIPTVTSLGGIFNHLDHIISEGLYQQNLPSGLICGEDGIFITKK